MNGIEGDHFEFPEEDARGGTVPSLFAALNAACARVGRGSSALVFFLESGDLCSAHSFGVVAFALVLLPDVDAVVGGYAGDARHYT